MWSLSLLKRVCDALSSVRIIQTTTVHTLLSTNKCIGYPPEYLALDTEDANASSVNFCLAERVDIVRAVISIATYY